MDASKRQLPSWMIGATAASTNPVSGPKPETKVKVDDDDDPKVHKPRARKLKSRVEAQKHGKTSISSEDESEKGNSEVPKKSGGRGSKRLSDTEHKPKAKALKRTTNDIESDEESSLSEVELTVEDLVSIAKEIVKTSAKKDEEEISSPMKDEEEISSPVTERVRVSSSSSSTSCTKDDDDERLHSRSIDNFDEDDLFTNLPEPASDFIENQTPDTVSITSSPGETRHAAQDMLEILFGPGYKKSKTAAAATRKPDPLPPVKKTTTIDYDQGDDGKKIQGETRIAFDQGDKQKKRKGETAIDSDRGDKQTKPGEVEDCTLTKKKSSLKDKVAMLMY